MLKGDTMPVIRVDDDVYEWLQTQARPFEDTPNSVLRRVAGLEGADSAPKTETEGAPTIRPRRRAGIRAARPIRGAQLAAEEGLADHQAYYHRGGTWYQRVNRFPAVLFDPHGCVVFRAEEAYLNAPGVNVGEKTNIPSGLSSLPGYRRMKHPVRA